MAHIHSVYDTDKHFTIDPATRELVNQTPTKVSIAQGDHNSERITIDLPRIIEGHDMTTCNRVEVHYRNIDSKTEETCAGYYEVGDLQVSPNGEDTVICSWLIDGNATQLVGPLHFRFSFMCCETKDVVDYCWNTKIYKGLSVDEGILSTVPGGGGGSPYKVVGVESIEQTYTSKTDEGSNVITATLTDGTTSVFYIRNGSTGSTGATGPAGAKGADGYTPVKGTDYWTAADKADMVADVLDAITAAEEVSF